MSLYLDSLCRSWWNCFLSTLFKGDEQQMSYESLRPAGINFYNKRTRYTQSSNLISHRFWSGKWPASLWRPKVLRRRPLWPLTAVILTHWSGGSYVFWVSYMTQNFPFLRPPFSFVHVLLFHHLCIYLWLSDLFKTPEKRPVFLWAFIPTQLAAVNPFNPYLRWSYWVVPIFLVYTLVLPPSLLSLSFF